MWQKYHIVENSTYAAQKLFLFKLKIANLFARWILRIGVSRLEKTRINVNTGVRTRDFRQ